MVKLSVIVPVWGVEKYLSKCLDSLVNQTLEDIEIIVVDDGMNSLDNVYAGGDCVSGAATVILAMEAGKKAALEIINKVNKAQ